MKNYFINPVVTHLNRSLQTWTTGFEGSLSIHGFAHMYLNRSIGTRKKAFVNRANFALTQIDVYASKMHIAVHSMQTPFSFTKI